MNQSYKLVISDIMSRTISKFTDDSNISLMFKIEFYSNIRENLNQHSNITATWISFMQNIMIFTRKKQI